MPLKCENFCEAVESTMKEPIKERPDRKILRQFKKDENMYLFILTKLEKQQYLTEFTMFKNAWYNRKNKCKHSQKQSK